MDVTAERFSALAEAIPQLMWVAEPNGAVEYCNQAWLDYTGVGVDALRDRGVKNIVHPDDVAMTWEHWDNALLTGEPYEIEYRLRNARSGTYRWFLARAAPYRDARGQIVRWIGTATDIDAQKASNANLRFVLDAANVLGANLDVDRVCRALSDLAIRSVADWCFVVLKDEAGVYRTRAIAHRDAELVHLIEQVAERYLSRRGSALERAVRHNTPILVPSIGDRDLEAVTQDERHLKILRDLHMHSAMLIPLSTDAGLTYGGIMLVSSESARRYQAGDLEVVEMVARRAAAAIATATAFGQERERSRRLQFIARAGDVLGQSGSLPAMLDRFLQNVVAEMADLAYVILAENNEVLRTAACAHRDPRKAAIARRLCGQRTLRPEAEENAVLMLAAHRTMLHKHVPLDAVLDSMWDYLAADVRALEIQSAITVPLFSHGETFGALVVYRCGSAPPYTEEDASTFTDLGRRLSVAIEHQRTLERERRIAEALQQALLPQPNMLPAVPGLQFAAHYRPSARDADVGGDWYDAFTLEDGSIVVSVGDVAGRGLDAAGLMGKLRQALGMAALYETDPVRMLDAVDLHLRSRRSGSLATAFVGVIDPGKTAMRYAGAGHPPPLLRRRGEIVQLTSAGLPLGLRDQHPGETREISLEGAELLVLYTDGMLEATKDVEFGERRLASLVASDAISCVRNPAEFLCEAALPPDAQDDTAVITVLFGDRTSWSFDVENAQAAHEARTELAAYLRERAPAGADVAAAELVFGELVGNVVRHAPGPIEVQVEWNAGSPVLHVIDRGRGFIRNPSLPRNVLSESRRGLYIVSQLAVDLRIERVAGYGNHVAATLRL